MKFWKPYFFLLVTFLFLSKGSVLWGQVVDEKLLSLCQKILEKKELFEKKQRTPSSFSFKDLAKMNPAKRAQELERIKKEMKKKLIFSSGEKRDLKALGKTFGSEESSAQFLLDESAEFTLIEKTPSFYEELFTIAKIPNKYQSIALEILKKIPLNRSRLDTISESLQGDLSKQHIAIDLILINEEDTLFRPEEFTQPARLLQRIQEEQDPVARYLLSYFGKENPAIFSQGKSPKFRSALSESFNQLIEKEQRLYESLRAIHANLTVFTRELGKKLQENKGNRSLLNRLVIQESYPKEIAPRCLQHPQIVERLLDICREPKYAPSLQAKLISLLTLYSAPQIYDLLLYKLQKEDNTLVLQSVLDAFIIPHYQTPQSSQIILQRFLSSYKKIVSWEKKAQRIKGSQELLLLRKKVENERAVSLQFLKALPWVYPKSDLALKHFFLLYNQPTYLFSVDRETTSISSSNLSYWRVLLKKNDCKIHPSLKLHKEGAQRTLQCSELSVVYHLKSVGDKILVYGENKEEKDILIVSLTIFDLDYVRNKFSEESEELLLDYLTKEARIPYLWQHVNKMGKLFFGKPDLETPQDWVQFEKEFRKKK